MRMKMEESKLAVVGELIDVYAAPFNYLLRQDQIKSDTVLSSKWFEVFFFEHSRGNSRDGTRQKQLKNNVCSQFFLFAERYFDLQGNYALDSYLRRAFFSSYSRFLLRARDENKYPELKGLRAGLFWTDRVFSPRAIWVVTMDARLVEVALGKRSYLLSAGAIDLDDETAFTTRSNGV